MNNWLKRWGIPGAIALVLLVAVGVQVIARMQPVPEGTLKEPLSTLIPSVVQGWTVEELGLGSTESVVERSRSLLKLDDFVHRNYKRGDEQFSVYIAYWKPGKMPVRLVNQHTPDRCWTEVGYTCTDRKWNVEKTVDGQKLQPGQWGIYELDGYTNYTYFWHVVGNEVHWYGGNRLNTQSSLTSIFEDFRKFGLNVYREQFFVRIVSDKPMDKLWSEPVFKDIMLDLAELCLAEPDGDATLAGI